MNLNFSNLPSRSSKTRSKGLTIIQDKGSALESIEKFISSSGHHVDFARISPASLCSAVPLANRVKKYLEADIIPLMSGIIFEAAFIRDDVDKYLHMLESAGIDHIELSDSVVEIKPEQKAEMIRELSDRFTIFSKIGPKIKTMSFRYQEWKDYILAETGAGSKKIIIEGGETGTLPVFSGKAQINVPLINHILKFASIEDTVWEAPGEEQQIWFITRFGSEVNLADIDPLKVPALESHRNGISWQTFRNNISVKDTGDKKLRSTDPIFETDFQL